MPPIAIVLIVILAAHYFIAIATIFALLREKGVTKAIIPWNLVILLIPILGPLAYWLYRLFRKKAPKSETEKQVTPENAPFSVSDPATESVYSETQNIAERANAKSDTDGTSESGSQNQ